MVITRLRLRSDSLDRYFVALWKSGSYTEEDLAEEVDAMLSGEAFAFEIHGEQPAAPQPAMLEGSPRVFRAWVFNRSKSSFG